MQLEISKNVNSNGVYKTKTNLSVRVELITPEIAKNYLRFNSNNRDMKKDHVTFFSNQIKEDLFLENGQPIIFDTQGFLKDGQHRLKAISINSYSFYIPVVRGVNSHCMPTYDTGKNRSSSDVLKLNGFKYCSQISALVKSIDKFKIKKSKSSITKVTNRIATLTNQQVLNYVEYNYEWLLNIVSKTQSITDKMKPKVLSPSNISLIIYLIGGENPSNEVYNFIKHLTGVVKLESSAPLYLYNKLYNSKINKEPLNNYWILGMAIKAWNYYNDGNPAINYFKFSVDQELPKIN